MRLTPQAFATYQEIDLHLSRAIALLHELPEDAGGRIAPEYRNRAEVLAHALAIRLGLLVSGLGRRNIFPAKSEEQLHLDARIKELERAGITLELPFVNRPDAPMDEQEREALANYIGSFSVELYQLFARLAELGLHYPGLASDDMFQTMKGQLYTVWEIADGLPDSIRVATAENWREEQRANKEENPHEC